MNMSARWKKLEQEIIHREGNRTNYAPEPNDYLLSIAVSLKRIADTLDGTTAGVCVTETIFAGRKG